MGAIGAYLHRRKLWFSPWILAGLAVLVSLLVADAALFAYVERPGGPLHPYELRISAIEWFLGLWLMTSVPGINASAATPITVILTFTNCELFCNTLSVGSAATNTSGFAVAGSDLPLSIVPGATGNISVTLSGPASGYSGPVAVILGH